MSAKENEIVMIPRWVVDNALTKKVAIRGGLWCVGTPILTVLPLWFFEVDENVPIALLAIAIAVAVGSVGFGLSTKEMRSRMVPADEWIKKEQNDR